MKKLFCCILAILSVFALTACAPFLYFGMDGMWEDFDQPASLSQLTQPSSADFAAYAGQSESAVLPQFGESYETSENASPDDPYVDYIYTDFMLSFSNVGGDSQLEGLAYWWEDSPLTVGGVTAGMAEDAATAALSRNGYEYVEGSAEALETPYYTAGEDRDVIVINLGIDNSSITWANAWYGERAQQILHFLRSTGVSYES